MNWAYLRRFPWLDTRARFVAAIPAGGTLLDLGNVYDDKGDHDKALDYYKQSLQIEREIGDEGMQAIWPYLAALFIGLLIVAAVPWLSIGFL